LYELSEAEAGQLKDIELKINSANPANRMKATRTISREQLSNDSKDYLTLPTIIKFANKSPLFKAICEDESMPHIKKWAATLQNQKHVYFEINSLDLAESKGVGSLYLGQHCWQEYEKAEKVTPRNAYLSSYWLDQACDFGNFSALTTRLQNIAYKIKEGSAQREDLANFTNDASGIANLYGTMGYLHIALVYLDLGRTLDNDDYKLKAASHFLCGQILYDNKDIRQTNRVLTILTNNKGLETFGYINWQDAKKDFLKPLSAEAAATVEAAATKNIHDKIEQRATKFNAKNRS
jgi:predicted negative regulator of RcsB-dependent stress response